MNKFFFISLLLIGFSLQAQKDRYKFAATYFGLEGEYISENKSFYFLDNTTLNKEQLPSTFTPRFLIGGTHFWGHADFYISIPLVNLRINGSNNAHISNEVFTGFRYLPITSKSKTISPYLGLGFNSKEFRQEGSNGKGPIYTNWQWYKEAGISYRSKSNTIFEIGARYFNTTSYNSFIDLQSSKKVEVSPFSFSIAYKKVFDFTSNYSSEKSQRYMHKVLEQAKNEGALSAFSFGIGLSALIPLDKSEFAERLPFFNDEIEGNVTIDAGVGYYSNPLDATIRMSYRPLKQEESAYNYTHKLRKHSFALEAFKFIGDYHGSAPFIGPYISTDLYRLKESDSEQTLIDESNAKLGYGIVFGWDIRQTNIDYLILRTNLRYTPELNYEEGGYRFTSEQLEFNFIQLVYYPERHKIYKKQN